MMMTRVLRSIAILGLLLAAGGPLAAQVQVYDFRYVMSVGDSLTAGYCSASLVETNQANSVPALLVRQGGTGDFQQPLISEPGIPAQLVLKSLAPVVIAPKSGQNGVPRNPLLQKPYNNLGVPGATALDALTRRTDSGGFHDLILRGYGTQVEQTRSVRPSLVTLWIGNNDVLGAVVRGQAIDGVTLTPTASFRQIYSQIVSALRETGPRIVAANLFDVTSIPYVTTVKPYVVDAAGNPRLENGNPVPLLGPTGPLASGTFLTLPASAYLAQGIGIPTAYGGTGQSLPDEVILDAAEVAMIRDHISLNNQAISEICQQAGIPVADVNGFLSGAARNGIEIGGVRFGSAFLSGGLFSYDGIHPTALGYALLANEWIKVMNQNGGALPLIDLAPFMGIGFAEASGLGPLGPNFEFTEEAWASLLAAFPTVDRR